MFARALLAFLACPGIVAAAIPVAWMWLAGAPLAHPEGLLVLCLGLGGLLWCVRDFYVTGRGTLAPWAPPQTLVVIGLYGYSRNPMYIAVTLILLGWAISYASGSLFLYALTVSAIFHLHVVLGEEPWLARTHPAEWPTYKARVPRWLW
jgi:protein-S-isoprenylcysteine O-methyltransferase Ste14